MNTRSSPADNGLTNRQRETLRALLDTFVPASTDARMPSAADLPQLVQQLTEIAASRPAARERLDALQAKAIAREGADFAALDADRRSSVLDEANEGDALALRQLALETVTAYYQQDLVLERIGLEARPPFPKGYQILAGDLSLLKAVKARGRIYRDPGEA